jgi:hypothetical protein
MNGPALTETGPALAPLLFGNGDLSPFVLLDGASAPGLVKQLYEHEPEYCCLYRGELEPDMAVVAPYLARLEPGTAFAELILKEGWGAHWGSLFLTGAELRTLRDHFRQFHSVELPDQRTVLFRYYDPRVLRSFLPVCNAEELKAFFGPVQQFIVEGDSPESGMKFGLVGQALKAEPFTLKQPSR